MLIGTDVNIWTCRAEGYPVVNATTKKLNPDKEYRLTISNPDRWTDEGRLNKQSGEVYHVDHMLSYRELWDAFEREGKKIKEYCDFDSCPIPSPDEEPDFFDFVSLASVINNWCGLSHLTW